MAGADTECVTGHEDYELGTDGPKMIVVGLDGSRTSWRAASYANGLARRQRSHVTVVYVVSPSALATMTADGAGAMLVTQVREEVGADLRAEVERVPRRQRSAIPSSGAIFPGRQQSYARPGG